MSIHFVLDSFTGSATMTTLASIDGLDEEPALLEEVVVLLQVVVRMVDKVDKEVVEEMD